MIITDTHSALGARPVSSLTRALSQISLEEQGRPAKKAALAIASETLKSEQSRQIIFHCNAIDRDVPSIQVNTREALSTYLVNNQIQNPGSLSERQQGLCAWTLLEHVARKDRGFQKVNAALVGSYIRPVQKATFEVLAKSMNLDPVKFIA
jgi:hypothetical protein